MSFTNPTDSNSPCNSNRERRLAVSIRVIDWDDAYLINDEIDTVYYYNIQRDSRYPKIQTGTAVAEYHDRFFEMIVEKLSPLQDEPPAKQARVEECEDL